MSVIAEKLRIVEAIVRTPSYEVIGYTHNKLVYSSAVDGDTDLWSLDLDTFKTIRLTHGGVHSVASVRRRSPIVVYTYDVSRGRELEQVFMNEVYGDKETRLEGMRPMRILGLGFDGDAVALAASTEKMMELWLLRLDGEAEKIHEVGAMLFVTDYNDGKIVGHGILKGDPRSYEIFIYDLKRSEFKIYTPKEGSVNRNPRVRGDLILFTTTAFGDEELAVYDAAKGRLERPKFSYRDHERYKPKGYVSFDWTPDGRVWFIGKREGRTRVFIDGKEIPMPSGLSSNLAITENRVYITHSSLTSPARIYEASLDAEGRRVILEGQLPGEVSSRFGETRFITYRSQGGLEIPAYVIESRAAQKPGPTVVYVHGGPWSEVSDSWRPMIASLVASGYHVVAPNFRGSTGYGEEFRRLNIGDPGGGDLLDVVNAAKWARESGLASRVAVMGYSYGGYMTFLVTVKSPDVWDAGVAEAGVVDWDEMYRLSDAYFKRFINVLFDGRRDLWRDRSPAYFAEKLKVPLCIVHPQNDSRTPLRPVLRYAMKLLELGKTFELHVVPEIGHLVRSTDDVVKILMPAMIFLDKYLSEKSA